MYEVNQLLSYDGIISGTPYKNKASLQRANNFFKKGTKFVHNNFSNDLIDNITKAYRPKIVKTNRIINFMDKHDKDLHNIILKKAIKKNIPNKRLNIILKDVPISDMNLSRSNYFKSLL